MLTLFIMEQVLKKTLLLIENLSWTQAPLTFFLLNLMIFILAMAISHFLIKIFRKHRVSPVPAPLNKKEITLTISCIFINTLITMIGFYLFKEKLIQIKINGFGLIFIETFGLFFIMDFLMFLTHRLMHTPILYKLIHSVHHEYKNVRPLTLFVLHPLEVIGFGALWLGLLMSYPFHLLAICIYLVFNMVFGALGHLGVETFPEKLLDRFPVKFVGTSRFHAQHHLDIERNFGFYTQIWDRLFNSRNKTNTSHF